MINEELEAGFATTDGSTAVTLGMAADDLICGWSEQPFHTICRNPGAVGGFPDVRFC